MAGIRVSGTAINETVITPATVFFNITDDDVAAEVDETYPVELAPLDTTVTIVGSAVIVIEDNFDRIQMGFESLNFIRVEGNETGVTVRINGENIRDIFYFYVQEVPGGFVDQTMLSAPAGVHSEEDIVPPIINPDDQIALQDDRTFDLGLAIMPEFVGDVELGAVIGGDQTYDQSTLTILDNDIVTVSFDQPSYTVNESGSVEITLQLDKAIATNFSVIVRAISNSTVGRPSIPDANYSALFSVSSGLQSQTFTLTPVDDNAPSEPDETGLLIVYFVSDGRVEEGPPAELVIVDDDELERGVGFRFSSYTFLESDSFGVVTVDGPSNFPPGTFSYRITGGPGRQPGAVVTSGMEVDEPGLTAFPFEVPFIITDDEAALEPDERYSLSIVSSDPALPLSHATTEIVILDDDTITAGFPYEEKQFPVSAVGNASIVVFGQAQQAFQINYVQAEARVTIPLNFDEGVYPTGFQMQLPIATSPDISPETVLMLGLVSPTDGVEIGGLVPSGGSETLELFQTVNITFFDDTITVGFLDAEYVFPERGSSLPFVVVGKSGDLGSSFSVQITTGGASPSPFIIPSGVPIELSGSVTFSADPTQPDSEPYALDIRNDDVALEDNETLILSLISPSSSRVRIGGVVDGIVYYSAAIVVIEDEDLAVVGFDRTSYDSSENRPFNIDVQLFNDIVPGRSVEVSVIEQSRGDMQFVSQSFSLPPNSLEFSSGADLLSVSPTLADDGVGLEDEEGVVLSLVAVSNPAQIILEPATTSVNIQDDDLTIVEFIAPARRTILEGEVTTACVTKDIVTARRLGFLLTPLLGSAEVEDFSPTTNQSGTLERGLTSADMPICFRYEALEDEEVERAETFGVLLTTRERFPRGPGGLLVGRDELTITIIEPTVTPPPQEDVEDTVVGDPLFTVPIQGSGHLCYEIRGAADQYFNFISDSCVSVNAHYTQHTLATEKKPLHVVDEIAIRVVDTAGACVDILVDRNGCTTAINSAAQGSYNTDGVSVSAVGNRVTVAVPNCNDMDLDMEVVCETRNGIDMIRFEVMRGFNLRETSHGLLGQFWNIQISTSEFVGQLRNGDSVDDLVMVTLTPSQSPARRFPAWQETKTWDNRMTCLYAGNQNGGTIYEVADDHDTLIQGVYKDYITDSAFSTNFRFSQFNSTQCS
jgi:collagen type VI alpha